MGTLILMILIGLLFSALFLWITVAYLVGVRMRFAVFDVYNLLSFEFKTFEVTKRKVLENKSRCKNLQRLFNSIPYKILKFKEGWTEEEGVDEVLDVILTCLITAKMAESMNLQFEDNEETLSHPLLQELTESDLEKYRAKKEKFNDLCALTQRIEEVTIPEISEVRDNLIDLGKELKGSFQVYVPCIRKLPVIGRPKRPSIRTMSASFTATSRTTISI